MDEIWASDLLKFSQAMNRKLRFEPRCVWCHVIYMKYNLCDITYTYVCMPKCHIIYIWHLNFKIIFSLCFSLSILSLFLPLILFAPFNCWLTLFVAHGVIGRSEWQSIAQRTWPWQVTWAPGEQRPWSWCWRTLVCVSLCDERSSFKRDRKVRKAGVTAEPAPWKSGVYEGHMGPSKTPGNGISHHPRRRHLFVPSKRICHHNISTLCFCLGWTCRYWLP